MDTSTVDMSTGDGQLPTVDTGMSVQAAAAALGITERTVRRRIKRGELQASKVDGPHGDSWRVLLGVPPASTVDSAVHPGAVHGGQVTLDSPVQGPEVVELVRLVDTLTHRNEQLAGQVGFLQARVQDQERQIALLMAPQDEPTPATSRPWWKWWGR